MASNYNRKSGSSGSRKSTPARRSSSSVNRNQSVRTTSSRAAKSPASRGSTAPRSRSGYQQVSSVRIGDINQADRSRRTQKTYQRYVVRVVLVLVFIAALMVSGIIVYNSSLFTIANIRVTGVEHLTATKMTELASVPEGTTLLRVDASGIKDRLLKEAWVKDATVNRVFPDTLELVITERTIAAVVAVPVNGAQSLEDWAIASDHLWLMPIPAAGSADSKKVSDKVYEDAQTVLHITEVPIGIQPVIGSYCTDDTVNNALDIIAGLTTDLADQVKTVSATGTETTTLTLEGGVEIAFGNADNIRDKERVIQKLLEDNPGQISHINVRVVDRPTWRAL